MVDKSTSRVTSTLATGGMACSMEKASLFMQMELLKMEFGNKANSLGK